MRQSVLSVSYLDNLMGSLTNLTVKAEQRDHQRWPVIGKWIWGQYSTGGTFAEEVEVLRKYLDGRLRWLDINLPGQCP